MTISTRWPSSRAASQRSRLNSRMCRWPRPKLPRATHLSDPQDRCCTSLKTVCARRHSCATRVLPVTPFAAVRSESDLDAAVAAVGLPAVMKTASWGYDGKGQARVDSRDQASQTWRSLGAGEAILERWIDFASELSVVAVRNASGELACFDPITNIHRHHILDVSLAPGWRRAAGCRCSRRNRPRRHDAPGGGRRVVRRVFLDSRMEIC
jgi:phosphoribosylaminoimidazole carboxylase (NCAIR synthetase)